MFVVWPTRREISNITPKIFIFKNKNKSIKTLSVLLFIFSSFEFYECRVDIMTIAICYGLSKWKYVFASAKEFELLNHLYYYEFIDKRLNQIHIYTHHTHMDISILLYL